MCQNDKTISCEISYLPLEGRTNDRVDEMLSLITGSGLDYEIGHYRTILRGDMDAVMTLIQSLYKKADAFGRFVIDVRFSNACGY